MALSHTDVEGEHVDRVGNPGPRHHQCLKVEPPARRTAGELRILALELAEQLIRAFRAHPPCGTAPEFVNLIRRHAR
jgi:hypothetical protein